MKRVDVVLEGLSPISFSRAIQSTKNTGEGADDFEERTWRERMHVNAEGQVFIPPMALKKCLENVARYLSESIPGKGKKTYTQRFMAGILIVDPGVVCGGNGKPIKASEVQGERLFVPSDGRKGGGTRVHRIFPTVPVWQCSMSIYLLDPLLIDKPQKVQEYLEHAGQFIGLMRFRPANGGFYGRFKVTSFKVVDEKSAAA